MFQGGCVDDILFDCVLINCQCQGGPDEHVHPKNCECMKSTTEVSTDNTTTISNNNNNNNTDDINNNANTNTNDTNTNIEDSIQNTESSNIDTTNDMEKTMQRQTSICKTDEINNCAILAEMVPSILDNSDFDACPEDYCIAGLFSDIRQRVKDRFGMFSKLWKKNERTFVNCFDSAVDIADYEID